VILSCQIRAFGKKTDTDAKQIGRPSDKRIVLTLTTHLGVATEPGEEHACCGLRGGWTCPSRSWSISRNCWPCAPSRRSPLTCSRVLPKATIIIRKIIPDVGERPPQMGDRTGSGSDIGSEPSRLEAVATHGSQRHEAERGQHPIIWLLWVTGEFCLAYCC
jgi:hypothetical protein